MNESLAAADNPLCTRCVRPGAIPFLFTGDLTVEQCIERLRQASWRGQIVGPHGSGKSTLLAALVPAIESAGRPVLVLELHDGQRCLPADFRRALDECRREVIAVDGYEQLNHWNRFRLKRRCRRCGLGLVVTAHRPVGLPELFRTETDDALAWRIVERLLGQRSCLVTRGEVADVFSTCGGDMRETLFALYDLLERRR